MTLHADIAVIGASLGGVMAAWQACQAGHCVILTVRYPWLGGQMTAQGVPPDEHRLIEQGGASASYLNFRAAMRAHYLHQPDFQDRTCMTEGCNPGDGWVSRLCFEPRVAAHYFESLLAPFVANGQLQLLRNTRPAGARVDGGQLTQVTVQTGAGVAADLDITADYFLDATDTGDLLALTGLPYRLGKELQSEFNESLAPKNADAADRLRDQQPVTHVLALKRQAAPGPVVAAPAGYAFWRAYQLPAYRHALFSEFIPGGAPGESVRLPLFASADPADPTLDLWRYRRAICAHNWNTPREESSLINWAHNDYGLHALLDSDLPEAQVEAAARALSLCLLHWLQTEAPRPDSLTPGYPELQPDTALLGTHDGLAQQVYVRESRRLVGLQTLAHGDIALAHGDTAQAQSAPLAAAHCANSVGVAWYNMDMHPTCVSGQGLNAHVRPFELPLGIFVSAQVNNLIPACKNISVTHLVNACTRVHPAEWLIGEVAALIASRALRTGNTPAQIHADPEQTAQLQTHLQAAGIPIHWDDALLATLS